jgi:hypothetical protein
MTKDMGASASQTGLWPTVEPVSAVSPPDGASIPSAVGFVVMYSDGSGAEIEVRFDAYADYFSDSVKIGCHGGDIYVPLEHLDWLIAALVGVRDNRRAASGTEARRAETAETGSVHDGPVPPQAADAQTPPNEHTKGDH